MKNEICMGRKLYSPVHLEQPRIEIER
uniref:Uncharacterized protein n=1 Tax=Lepeophtheirus salmonis TaxID=72036 RepID=A0A0K2T2I4_LEPSM